MSNQEENPNQCEENLNKCKVRGCKADRARRGDKCAWCQRHVKDDDHDWSPGPYWGSSREDC